MPSTDPITDFVRHALQTGGSPAQIDAALADAGWSDRERQAALAGWTTTQGLPPVPRPRPYVSAREALLYGLLFITLGMVAFHLCQMGFLLVDTLLPDPEQSDYYRRRSMQWPMAGLITFTPIFLILNRIVSRNTGPEQRRSLVRRWCASITLLFAAMALLVDLFSTIYALLSGDMTLRFALNAAIVALTAGLVVAYYRDELDD